MTAEIPLLAARTKWQSFLDTAQPRLGEVLAGPGRIAEPGVVGHIQDQARIGAVMCILGPDTPRENRLIADSSRDRREPGASSTRHASPHEPARHLDELAQTQRAQ